MAYEVEVTDEFVEWWDKITEEEQEALAARVELLEARGPVLRRPYSGEIHGSAFDPKMKELICDVGHAHLRVLYIFNTLQTPILLLGGDKTGLWQAWYDENISKADALYRQHQTETLR